MRVRVYLRSLRAVSPWRWLLAIAIVLFGLVSVSVDLDWPSIWFVEVERPAGDPLVEPRSLTPWLASLSAVLTALLAGASRVGKGLRVSAAELKVGRRNVLDRLQEQTRVFFVQVSDDVAAGLKCEFKQAAIWREMTVRLYVVEDSGKESVLSSAAKVWHHNRQSSELKWTKGVGCVGLAWETGDAARLWGSRPERLDALKTPSAWRNAPDDMKQGLDHDQALKLQKLGFGAVLAHPIRVSEEIRAVLAIDFRADGYYKALCMNEAVQDTVDRYINLVVFDLEALREAPSG